MNLAKIENDISQILKDIGEDTNREGLKETPKRVAKMFKEIYGGINQNLEMLFEKRFTAKKNSLVLIKGISFYSMCEHHMLPFYGKVDIGYISNDYVLGLSKFYRIVEVLSSKLTIQERLTDEIAHSIFKYLDCKAVVVKIEAKHMCILMRGVKKENSIVTTYSECGLLNDEERKMLYSDIMTSR